MDALSIQTGLSLQDIELQETSLLCVASTKKSTPKHVLLMQNWKPGMNWISQSPKHCFWKREIPHVSMEIHCSGRPLPGQLLACLFLTTREKCVAPIRLGSITHRTFGGCSSRSAELLCAEGQAGEQSSAPHSHCPGWLGKPRLLLLPSALLEAKLSRTADGDPLNHRQF